MSEMTEAWTEHLKKQAITKRCTKCYALDKNYFCLAKKVQENILTANTDRECEEYIPSELTFAQYYPRTFKCNKVKQTFTKLEKFLLIILTIISIYLIMEGAGL